MTLSDIHNEIEHTYNMHYYHRKEKEIKMAENLDKYVREIPLEDSPYEIGKEIIDIRYRITRVEGISPMKKILLQRTLDFIIAILNDDKMQCGGLLDIVSDFYHLMEE